jgi:hypothetical protein
MYTNNNEYNTVPVYAMTEQISNEHNLVPVYTATVSNQQLYSNYYDNYNYHNNSDCNVQLLPTNNNNTNNIHDNLEQQQSDISTSETNNGKKSYIVGFIIIVGMILMMLSIYYGKILYISNISNSTKQ